MKHLTPRKLLFFVIGLGLLVWLAITMDWLPPGDTHETPLGAGEKIERPAPDPGLEDPLQDQR